MGYRILLADDDSDLQFLTRMALTDEGFEVICVSNGKEAVDAALAGHFDLILLDADMPVMDGFEAYRMLRSRPSTASVPVIFLTARTPDDVMRKNLDPLHFILKPFDAELLPETIRKMITKA